MIPAPEDCAAALDNLNDTFRPTGTGRLYVGHLTEFECLKPQSMQTIRVILGHFAAPEAVSCQTKQSKIIADRLYRSVATAINDDRTAVDSEMRKRHVERVMTMLGAAQFMAGDDHAGSV